ncbi:MAG: NTP transferase domain-containing protein [bacterium]|nr:NTP transferase domain-containing protein [bacterium]
MNRPDRAVIPVAGLATRMHPLSRVTPKELLPLGRKPILHHVVEELARVGVTEFQMVISERTRAIERYFAPDPQLDPALLEAGLAPGWTAGNNDLSSCSFHFAHQDVPSGIADAVHRARAFVDRRPFFLHMGDSVLSGDPDLLERMADAHERYGAVCAVAIQRMPEKMIRARAAVVARGNPDAEAFEIERIIEKPAAHEIAIGAGLIGRYLISAPMLDAPRSEESHSSPIGGLQTIFPAPQQLTGPVIAIWCRPEAALHDAGTLDEYLRAQAFFALRDGSVGRDLLAMAREMAP